MPDLDNHKRDWDTIAELDACWAILSEPDKKYNKWSRDEFFQKGEQEILRIMEVAARLGFPKQFGHALDFGCGLGRLTRPLAGFFKKVSGVDISMTMIEKAREIHRDNPACEFILNEKDDLAIFPDGEFDFVYSNIVLQHMPAREIARRYIREFVRVTRKEGLIVFQLPGSLPVTVKVQPRRTMFLALRKCGFSEQFLYRGMGLHPIRTLSISERNMKIFFKSLPVKVLRIDTLREKYFGINSKFYYLAKTD